MSESSKFSKREWIHLIITLSIVQAVIWFASFIFAGSSNALGYASFAGTLISIILAVLAIGYTYGESQQQKNLSGTLSNQIESLIKIKDKLEIQADALTGIKDLHHSLGNISQKLDGHFAETKTKLDDFKGSIQYFGAKSSDDLLFQNYDLENVIKGVFSETPSHFIKLSLIIAILYCENRKIDDPIGEIANYIKKLDIDELDDENKLILFGGSVNLLHILTNLKAIQKKGNNINPKLLSYFNEFVKDEDINFNKGFKGAASRIKELGKTSKYYIE